ncbi:hypothetical protein ACWAUC_15075 [Bradyrhizobium guangdongense]
MTDAFDRWIEWAKKSPDKRSGLSSEIHAAVMSLPKEQRADRQRVNAAVEHQAELRRSRRTAWVYLNDYQQGTRRNVGDPEWVKVFGCEEAASRWLDRHDPEGVVWEYEIEGGRRESSIWIYPADNRSREIGARGWAKLFASKEAAENWLEQNAPTGKAWAYPVMDE